MSHLSETIEAILATDKPEDNKRAAIKIAKADAWAKAAPKELLLPSGHKVVFKEDPSVNWKGMLCLDFEVEGLNLDTPFYIMNPPVLVEAEDGDIELNGATYKEDVRQALENVLMEFIGDA